MVDAPQNGQSTTPALDAFLKIAQTKPAPKRGVAKAFNGFLKKPSIDVAAFQEALRSDLKLKLKGEDGRAGSDRTDPLVKFVGGEKPSDITLENVQAVQQLLKTLAGRAKFLCDAAAAGIRELKGNNAVDRIDVEARILAGLNLGLPDLPNKKAKALLVKIVGKAGETFPSAPSRDAAEKALRYEIQKRVVSDAIMAAFPNRGSKNVVVPRVLNRLQPRLVEAGLEEGKRELKAGRMSPVAINELEQALKERDFTEGVRTDMAPKRGKPQADGVGQLNTVVLKELEELQKKRA